MDSFIDIFKRKITLSEERKNHILNRLEMLNQEDKIEQTLSTPEFIKRSVSNENVVIYYKHYQTTPVTSKYLAVVVRLSNKENFIISAYFTNRIKKGELIWIKS